VYVGLGVYFAIIGLLGTGEIAAMNVVLTIMLLSILLASGWRPAPTSTCGTAIPHSSRVTASKWMSR
jgi:hypothetical protein